jgi:2-dehydro-3-deoxyphosphogluconate aldolase/(4S)-4-hydroxy-2-oxoglutarate aldolase
MPPGHGDHGRPPPPEPLSRTRIIAVLRRVELEDARRYVEALLSCGIRVVEVTFDEPSAEEKLGSLGEGFGDQVCWAAGTVFDPSTAERAIEAGASLIVSPHTDPGLTEKLASRGIPHLPGGVTPTEIVRSWAAGASVVKFFPASAVGAGYLEELRGPLRQIPLLATGGITVDSAGAFLKAGAWGVGLGSAVINPDLLTEPRLSQVTALAELASRSVS